MGVPNLDVELVCLSQSPIRCRDRREGMIECAIPGLAMVKSGTNNVHVQEGKVSLLTGIGSNDAWYRTTTKVSAMSRTLKKGRGEWYSGVEYQRIREQRLQTCAGRGESGWKRC